MTLEKVLPSFSGDTLFIGIINLMDAIDRKILAALQEDGIARPYEEGMHRLMQAIEAKRLVNLPVRALS